MAKGKEKVAYICSIQCPNCKETVDILKRTKTITPAEPAKKEEEYLAMRTGYTQKVLNEPAKETSK